MELSWEKSHIVIWKMLGLFVNTMAAHDKYSLLRKDNLTQPIQIQLPKNFFSLPFSAFLKSTLNFQLFLKQDDFHSWCISEITNSKRRG